MERELWSGIIFPIILGVGVVVVAFFWLGYFKAEYWTRTDDDKR